MGNMYCWYVERDGKEVDVDVEWEIENDGIGAYEFWGHRGYDKGKDYPIIEGVYDTEGKEFELTAHERTTLEEEHLLEEMYAIIGDK